MGIRQDVWGTTEDGTPIDIYTLTNKNDLEARIMTYGGILVSLRAPDRAGTHGDVTLGFDSLAPYLEGHPFFGALVGRYGNRIREGSFELEGKRYTLACNNGANHLHGGVRGFDKQVWRAEADGEGEPRLVLSYHSPDGEEGYPGNLHVTVTYALTDADELRIDYSATSDQATIVNLTNHTYFNLGADDDILQHEMQLLAERFLPIDPTFIPLGEERSVTGTPMDFRSPTTIGEQIHQQDEQLRLAVGGYDHTFVIARNGEGLAQAASVFEPTSGREMTVYTTQPGVQFYSGNMLEGDILGKGGKVYVKHGGFCLETQHFPDSPNQPQFPSTVLQPGETYSHSTVYRFGVRA